MRSSKHSLLGRQAFLMVSGVAFWHHVAHFLKSSDHDPQIKTLYHDHYITDSCMSVGTMWDSGHHQTALMRSLNIYNKHFTKSQYPHLLPHPQHWQHNDQLNGSKQFRGPGLVTGVKLFLTKQLEDENNFLISQMISFNWHKPVGSGKLNLKADFVRCQGQLDTELWLHWH